MTNFWKGLTKSEIDSLIKMHKDVATMNEQLQKARKQEAAEALRTHLLEAEAEWLYEHLGDLGAVSIGEHAELGEEISEMAWEDPYAKAQLSLARSQATDGYNQAQQAFKLLEQVYRFLVGLNETTRTFAGTHNFVVALMIGIEEFLPGLKEKHS